MPFLSAFRDKKLINVPERERQGGLPPKEAAKRQKDLIGLERMCCLCALLRGLENLDSPLKGFNCCSAKLRLWCAALRFAEPRISLQRGRFYVLFASCKKNQKARQRFANLWTPGTIQIAGRQGVFAKTTGVHQVPGGTENREVFGYRRQ